MTEEQEKKDNRRLGFVIIGVFALLIFILGLQIGMAVERNRHQVSEEIGHP